MALKLDLTFKTLVNAKIKCSKCKGYGHYNYQCPSENQHVRTVPTDEVDDSKAVKDDQVSSQTINIIEDIAVDSDSANDDVDKTVEPNVPTAPNQSFESPCVEPSFMVIPINSSFRESPEFLAKVQQSF